MTNKTIVKNEVILPKHDDTYQEVRHIVLKGSDVEIGKALGDMARLEYRVSEPFPYADAIYARAHREYIKDNYPILFERMKGVARSYGLAEDDESHNTSCLLYFLTKPGCSVVFFPPEFTTTGHPLGSRTTEFYTATFSEFIGAGEQPNSPYLFSRNYIMELYPDGGYASLVAGSLELLSGITDGINSEGLTVSLLSDNNLQTVTSVDLTRPAGLLDQQLARLLLDTCATVEEAKVAILRNKFYMMFDASHLLVSDASGRSFVAELSEKDFSIHFTDNDGKPQIMTNHSVWEYPDVSTFPDAPADARYNTFNRYRVLDRYLKGHEGKFTPEDAFYAISLVYANTDDSSEGAAFDLPCRTLWPVLSDCHDRSFNMRFYLKDGEADPVNGPSLVMSEPFEFKLKPK